MSRGIYRRDLARTGARGKKATGRTKATKPVVSATNASAKPDGGKNSGWGDSNGGGKTHPKKYRGSGNLVQG
jgi:hypothetical protein